MLAAVCDGTLAVQGRATYSRYIHDNAELAFEEFKTHNALTKFMCSQEDWHVTMSA
jgi:metal-dependent amidase/aminoacylase/carboxypeptidase family protein